MSDEFSFRVALKTPASFHEQRQKLQRAKMGDLLKHKIQHRPDRTELIRQHILEGIVSAKTLVMLFWSSSNPSLSGNV